MNIKFFGTWLAYQMHYKAVEAVEVVNCFLCNSKNQPQKLLEMVWKWNLINYHTNVPCGEETLFHICFCSINKCVIPWPWTFILMAVYRSLKNNPFNANPFAFLFKTFHKLERGIFRPFHAFISRSLSQIQKINQNLIVSSMRMKAHENYQWGTLIQNYP